MIYIVKKYSDVAEHYTVDSVWEVNSEDVNSEYNSFILDLAAKQEIVVNLHWLNMMNHKDYHSNLTPAQYKLREKEWNKTLKRWPIEEYISIILKGNKLNYKELYG